MGYPIQPPAPSPRMMRGIAHGKSGYDPVYPITIDIFFTQIIYTPTFITCLRLQGLNYHSAVKLGSDCSLAYGVLYINKGKCEKLNESSLTARSPVTHPVRILTHSVTHSVAHSVTCAANHTFHILATNHPSQSLSHPGTHSVTSGSHP